MLFHNCSCTVSIPPGGAAPLGLLTPWTVRVQSRGGTKRVAPAASWEELAVIHTECVSGGLDNSAKGRKGGWDTLHTLLKQKTSHLHKTSAECVWRRGACVWWRTWRSICRFGCVYVCVFLSVFTDLNECRKSIYMHVRERVCVYMPLCVSACGYASGSNPPTA